MSQGARFSAAAAARVEAMYVTPDVVEQRRIVLEALALRPAERVLDIGLGPGLLALELAQAVGSSGRVAGLDLNQSFLDLAGQRCAELPWISLVRADAARLPFADARFDAAVAAQVYEYVADVDAALRELARVLRPGGRAVIVDTDWDSLVWQSADRARMRRVLAAWEQHCADPHLPATLGPRLHRAGLVVERCAAIPLLNPDRDPNTYSSGLIELVRAFAARRGGLPADEVDAWAAELRTADESHHYFFSLNRYLFAVRKPAG